MEFTMKYKVPKEFIIADGDIELTVEVEVLGVGTPNETCFLTKVSGSGVNLLWGMKPCAALFDDVQRKAIFMAKELVSKPVKFKPSNEPVC